MNITVLRVVALSALCTAGFASTITVSRSTDTQMYNTWGSGYGYYGYQTIPQPVTQQQATSPTTTTTTASTTSTTTTQQSNPATPAPTPVSINVPAPSYNTSLSGSGLSYSLSGFGSGNLSGNPVALTSATPLTFSNYLNAVPTGDKLTGATLNLGLALGAAVTTLASGSDSSYFIPTLLANPGALQITITSGSVTQTLTGTSVSAYDLLANGFGASIAKDLPISVAFTLNDSFSASGGTYSFSGGRATSETLSYTDTRSLTASSSLNFLTLTATPPPSPTCCAPDPPPDPGPEPTPSLLVGCGLAFLGVLRFRKNRRA